MKYIFMTIFALLLIATAGTQFFMPDSGSDVPVIYWVSDPNPARDLQIEYFHKWLEKHDLPRCEARLDAANKSPDKQVIQGVSGVASDVMDIRPIQGLRYYHSMGLLENVTEVARNGAHRFDPSQTYPAIEPVITLDGQQYMFPCNVACRMLWVNRNTFEKYGQPLPPKVWDFDTFEKMGRDYIRAANPEGERVRQFYAEKPDHYFLTVMRRSIGLDIFNETLTRCVLDDQRAVDVYSRLHKWVHEDNILPSAADEESFSTDAGYGGRKMHLFNRGNYAMIHIGRWVLIQLRKFEPLPLSVVQLPCDDMPTAIITTRAAGVYSGSENKEAAISFLAYLASEDYNMQIVRDADALPPNPKFTELEEFKRPKDYPNEWGCHEAIDQAAREIAIVWTHSPFVLMATVSRAELEMLDAVMVNRDTPRQAATKLAKRVNEEIELTLKENKTLAAEYEKRLARQKRIDEMKANGEKIPLEMIDNPFLKRYYTFKGMAE